MIFKLPSSSLFPIALPHIKWLMSALFERAQVGHMSVRYPFDPNIQRKQSQQRLLRCCSCTWDKRHFSSLQTQLVVSRWWRGQAASLCFYSRNWIYVHGKHSSKTKQNRNKHLVLKNSCQELQIKETSTQPAECHTSCHLFPNIIFGPSVTMWCALLTADPLSQHTVGTDSPAL